VTITPRDTLERVFLKTLVDELGLEYDSAGFVDASVVVHRRLPHGRHVDVMWLTVTTDGRLNVILEPRPHRHVTLDLYIARLVERLCELLVNTPGGR